MTKEINPGRELDALIAEKVMGCTTMFTGTDGITKYCNCNRSNMFDNGSHEYGNSGIKPYSTDIAAAWTVVEHVKKSLIRNVFSLAGPSDESDKWFCTFEKKWHGHDSESIYDWEYGETAPHAICMAALKIHAKIYP